MEFFDPEGWFILQWNKTFLLLSVIALSLDPLFFYIPVVDGTQKCLDVDRKLEIAVCILRSFADILHVFHIIIQFRTAYVPRYNHTLGKRIFMDEPWYVARRYLKSYFVIDVLASLPLPQLAVLAIIPNLDGPSSFLTKNLLKLIIFSQFVPRVIRLFLFYKKVTKISGFLTEKAWAGAAFNFFLYVLASHVVGALWYLFAVESELRCWNIACQRQNCYSKYLYCGEGRVGNFQFLNTSCPLLERNEIKDATNFDFGIFLDALQTHVLETRDFPQKFLYCSWWGLQSLSSLGQGLKASTYYGEILFADFIAVIGLVLFALLIGNMQVPLFEKMDEHLLDAMCDRLKPVLYTENSRIILEGDPVPEMLFITRGEVLSVTTDGGRTGFFNSIKLKGGDFCGDELLTWALDPATRILPFSTRTVQAVTDVQAFALVADELLFVASQFRRLHSRSLQHTFRFYSQQWRTWAACYIQSAWRSHCKRKQEEALKEQNKRSQNALATSRETSTLSIGGIVNVSRFSSNALRSLRRNYMYNAEVSATKLHTLFPLKPAQPDFADDTTTLTFR